MKAIWIVLALAASPICHAQTGGPGAGAAAVQPEKATQPRPAIYDEKADARKQIAAAMKSAAKENRRVLIQWGGNWCSWCHLLHEKFKSDRAIARELMYEYDVVLVDAGKEGKNMDLARVYGADLEKGGFPFLTILDPAGNVIANQETGSLESTTPEGKPTEKPGHDSAKVLAFLRKHKATPLNATQELVNARNVAKASDRRVFLHFGAPWCGWCKKLDAWLAREDVAPVFGKDFVEVKIDQDRMDRAKEVFAQYKKDYDTTGIPWFVIIDAATGEALVTSDEPGPDGKLSNTGFPAAENEVAHFVTMLKATAKKMSDSDIAALKKTLEEGRKN